MSGCNWQNKSFSVVMERLATFTCRECNKETDGTRKYNGDILCQECFDKKCKKINLIDGIFFTEKDRQWNFTTDMFTGKPIEIHSKRQFNKLLKDQGMVSASVKELHQEAEFRKRLTAEDIVNNRKSKAKDIYYKMKARGQFGR